MDDEDNREEQRERPRPRVVDKRVSARGTEPPAPKSRGDAAPAPPQHPHPPPQPPTPPAVGPEQADEAPLWTPEREAEAERISREMAEVPARDWLVNAVVTLINVAATKLDQSMLEDARLCIDSVAAVLNSAGDRLGDAENPLRQTVAQLQMAYVQSTGESPQAD
jgi:hypothetical protein